MRQNGQWQSRQIAELNAIQRQLQSQHRNSSLLSWATLIAVVTLCWHVLTQ